MTNQQIMERLQEIFRDIFGNEALVVTEATCADDVAEWDSLKHITILQAIQDEFEVAFSIEDIASMKNVGDMITSIRDKSR